MNLVAAAAAVVAVAGSNGRYIPNILKYSCIIDDCRRPKWRRSMEIVYKFGFAEYD